MVIMLRGICTTLLVVTMTACASAQPEPGKPAKTDSKGPTSRERNKAVIQKLHEKHLKAYAGNAEFLVLPGLLADRKSKRIVIQAESTGLTAKGHPPEFFIIGEKSGHDYEALAMSFAKAGDIHKALLFIGMQSGRRVNFEKLQFWPKGERVSLIFKAEVAGKTIGPVGIDSLFLDKQTGKPLAHVGLVFTGSAFVDSLKEPGKKVYAADTYDPHSIAANYNEPTSTLDVPRQAPQKETYNNLAVNPDYIFPNQCLLEIIIEPEYKDGKKRVVDLQLFVNPVAGNPGMEPADLAFQLKNAQGKMLNKTPKINGVLKAFTSLTENGHDPFVTVIFGDNLTLKAAHAVCSILLSIDIDKGIRMEPPLAGPLYYRAHVPDKRYKDRESRYAQPWELKLSKKDGQLSGILTQIEQIWKYTKTVTLMKKSI